MTNRLSASKATWSQVSPLRSSAGSSGSQFASFLATKAHFSSNWTSRVRGGSGDQLVVQGRRMGPGLPAVAGDGLPIDADEPAGLADAVALGDVVEDRGGLLRWEVGAEERGALALGEASLAGSAAEHAAGFVRAVVVGHGEVSGPPLAVLGAVGIQAAEASEVVHGRGSAAGSTDGGTSCG